MIAAWMAYAFVIAALVSAAALIAERIAGLRRWPSRWIWVAALMSSWLLPVMFAWSSTRTSESTATALVALVAQGTPAIYERSPIAWVGGEDAGVTKHLSSDIRLLAGWSAMSALALLTLSMGWMQLRRRLRSAIDGELAGVSVRITHDIGPAVVGIIRPRIVIPRWLLQQDAETQRIVIAHETEHLRAQDIRVIGAALLVAVLLPWNLPLWWQLRRLRFAMEVDCDAGVLRAGHAFELLQRALERSDPSDAVAGSDSRSFRIRVVAGDPHPHHARAGAQALEALGGVPRNLQRCTHRRRRKHSRPTGSASDDRSVQRWTAVASDSRGSSKRR